MRKKVKKLNSRLTDSDNKDQSRGTVSLMAFSIFSSLNNWVTNWVSMFSRRNSESVLGVVGSVGKVVYYQIFYPDEFVHHGRHKQIEGGSSYNQNTE